MLAKSSTEALFAKLCNRAFFIEENIMNKNHGYIKARIKSQGQIAMVHPYAVYWGKPLDETQCYRGADEIVLNFVRKTIWVKKKRQSLDEFYYEIKDTGGLVVLPNWIAYFDSENLVPPAEWSDIYNPYVIDDIWLDYNEKRIIFVDDLLIITG